MSRRAATKEAAAHHEAGHAVASVVRGGELKLTHIFSLRFLGAPEDWRGDTDSEGLAVDDCAVVELAGRPAEARFLGEPPNLPEEEPGEWERAVVWSRQAGVPVDQSLEEALRLVDTHG